MITLRTNAGTLAGGLRSFAQRFPRVVQKRMDIFSRETSNVLRTKAARVVKSGISGRCVRGPGGFVALIRSRHLVGLWMEQGTGLHGPLKKLIVAKGGAYVDPVHGTYRRRRMLRIPVSGSRASGAGGGVSFHVMRGFIFRPWSRGMKATPWFFSTIRAQVPHLQRDLCRDLQQAVRELGTQLPR